MVLVSSCLVGVYLWPLPLIQCSGSQHGKVLGGSSSVGYMVYVRGHKSDYDSWEKLGCTGWGWSNVEKYFRKMEDYLIDDGKRNFTLVLH